MSFKGPVGASSLRKSRVVLAGLSLLSLFSLSACSLVSDDAEREYKIPRSLCGIEVEESVWRALFPPGARVRVDGAGDAESPDHGCSVWVDDELAIELGTDSEYREGGIEEYIRSAYAELISELDVNESEVVEAGEYEIRVWPRIALAYAECESSDAEVIGLMTSIWITDDGDHRDDLSQVILPYADARADQINPRWCDAKDAYP